MVKINRNIRLKIIIFSIIIFVLFIIIKTRIIKFQNINDEFSGILVEKRYSPPGAAVFYIKNKSGRHKKAGIGMTFYEAIIIGDSIVKKKGKSYVSVYKRKKGKYKLYKKFNFVW